MVPCLKIVWLVVWTCLVVSQQVCCVSSLLVASVFCCRQNRFKRRLEKKQPIQPNHLNHDHLYSLSLLPEITFSEAWSSWNPCVGVVRGSAELILVQVGHCNWPITLLTLSLASLDISKFFHITNYDIKINYNGTTPIQRSRFWKKVTMTESKEDGLGYFQKP